MKIEIGTTEYAMAKALEFLGSERVCEITGKSDSAIRKGINPNEPNNLDWLTVKQAKLLASECMAQDYPEFFSVDIMRSAEAMCAEVCGDSEAPEMVMSGAFVALSKAQRKLTKARHPDSPGGVDLTDEEIHTVHEAIERVGGFLRRLKSSTARALNG